jgi:hypothetical protein
VRGDSKQHKIGLLTDDGFDALNQQASVVSSCSWSARRGTHARAS